MLLEKRKYKGIDVLSLSFKVAPFAMLLYLVVIIADAVIPTTMTALATAFFVDTAIAIFKNERAANEIYIPLIALISTVGLINILSSIPQLIESKIQFELERKLVPEILEVQAKLAYKYIEDAESLELIEIVSDEMQETFLDGISAYGTIIRSVVAIVSVLGLVVTKVWWSALVVGLASILIFLISLWMGKENYKAKVQVQKYERRYSYYSDEILINREAIEERTLFGYTDKIVKHYQKDFNISAKIELRVLLKTIITMKATNLSLVIIMFSTAFSLIDSFVVGKISAGMFTGIITALFEMSEILGWQLQTAVKNISEAREYMEDLTKLLAFENVEGAIDLPCDKEFEFKKLEFKNVRFKYPKQNEYILYNISFKIEHGKHYAFVGSNGVGKTTITKLLTRLYEEYEGEILINDRELHTYSMPEIKALFSVVYQDFARYQITLEENIFLGNIKTKENQDIEKVALKAGLKDTIEKLPYGIKTFLGKINENGVDISGGQWQKVAIARSLLSTAPIKILDEPTSALDPIAENQIYQDFGNLMKDKTTVFISHRLGSTKLADEILVIDKGKIAGRGNHSELMKLNGIYAKMFEVQRSWYQ